MTSPTTKELLMRVIAVESPKLFDGSDNEPIEVTSYSYQEEGTRLCDTCDYPELLLIGYRTRSKTCTRSKDDESNNPANSRIVSSSKPPHIGSNCTTSIKSSRMSGIKPPEPMSGV